MLQNTVLFTGIDTIGYTDLWTTDGTAAGTHVLITSNTSGGVVGQFTGGENLDLTAFGGEVLFTGYGYSLQNGGYDSNGFGTSLWVTNLTLGGTSELTGIAGAPLNPIGNGLDPADLTVFNGKVLFEGNTDNQDSEKGLWVTDGTVAGTSELTGISGADTSGVLSLGGSSGDLTVFGNEVLFDGTNAGGYSGLWVTDGTATGTHELTGISGANPFGFAPLDLTVFKGKVLFKGNEIDSAFGLWVTDGTSVGTHELAVGGSAGGVDPSDMTVFNGEVLFNGADASNFNGLWVTDGTAGGTHELTGISDVSPVYGLDPTDLTALNDKVLFDGRDANGLYGLWVTDGTAAGTQEIVGSVAPDTGIFGGTDVNGPAPDFAVIDGKAVFSGFDAAGKLGLWVTDGTSAGTQELSVSGINATYGIDPQAFYALINAPVTGTVQTANGIDLRWATLYNEMANSAIGSGGTTTQYTCVDSGAFNGQSASIKFVVSGTGFTYSGTSPNIQLTGGTITGVQEQDSSNNVLATFTGLSIAATTFQAAMASYVAGGANPDPTALNAIFLAQAYQVTGGAGSDKLQGSNLDDTIIGSTGNDTAAGGTGTNTADYSGLTTSGLFAIVQGGGGTVNKGGANGTDTLTNVQNLVDNGSGRGNGDVFEVDSAENVTAGSSDFNYLIELSAGVNLAYGDNFTGISEFVSNVGANTLNFSNDQNFAYVFGSTGNDTLTLGSGGGYLFGEGGTNVLNGGANATNLFVGGQGGTDTMNGGTGSASNYYFVDGNDQVNGAGAFNAMIELVSGVTVQLGSAQYAHVQEFVSNTGTNAVTVANTDFDFTYLYGDTGNDTLTTGSGGGYLIGEGGTNVLTGGDALNVFIADGGAGVDTMNGGSGSNIYLIDANSTVHGGGTFNTVEELQQNATLVLGSAQLGSDVQQVVFNSGTNSADFHTATSSVFLYGNTGNDTLFGGTGNDFLYGGLGANTFKFGTGWGQDTIEDWAAGTNSIIDLTALTSLGVHAVTDLTQTITSGNDVITSIHTGTNSITLLGVGSALTAGSFHFA